MESSEFAFYFSNFPTLLKLFDGVYSFDKIPTQIKLHHFIICNTDISSGSGKHWFCVFRSNKKFLECFDSLGVGPEKQIFLKSVQFRGIRELNYNESPVQSVTSSACGEFCLFFLFERLHNLNFEFSDLINEIFSQNFERNEHRVREFYSTNQHGFVY